MRVLIDEDTAVQLIEPLRHLLIRHQVDHVSKIKWKGKKDRNVLPDAKGAGYDVIITRDRNQLMDPDECDAIKRSGLHHVRYAQRREGTEGLGLALGAIIAAMPMVMAALERASGQQLVHIAGLDPNRRYEMTDPKKDPPRYWRR
ncbi:MAG TPA: hypothetical protein VMV92_39305 [Streptosporangiaceae bacterium]|nr:hypothetical protein [Streptosporangiaceae bacterium]